MPKKIKSKLWNKVWILLLLGMVSLFLAYSNSINNKIQANSVTAQKQNGSKLFDDVILMGQFNYHSTWDIIKYWADEWHKYTNKIIIYTPMTPYINAPKNIPSWLTIRYFIFDNLGKVAPMTNVVDALKLFNTDSFNNTYYKGLIYMHDDMLLNLKTFDIMDPSWKSKLLYSCNVQHMTRNNKIYTIQNVTQFLPTWTWWSYPEGLESMRNAEKDPNIPKTDIITLSNDSIRWYGRCQSDFMYIPFTTSKLFVSIGAWLSRNNVFLEIAAPMVMSTLEIKHGFQVQALKLCTCFPRTSAEKMSKYCKSKGRWPADLMHPVKIGLEKLNSEWIKWFYFGHFIDNTTLKYENKFYRT